MEGDVLDEAFFHDALVGSFVAPYIMHGMFNTPTTVALSTSGEGVALHAVEVSPVLSHAGTYAVASGLTVSVTAGTGTAEEGVNRAGQCSAVLCGGTVTDVQVAHSGNIR